MKTRNSSDLVGVKRQTTRFQQLSSLAIEYEGSEQAIQLRPPDISARGMFINTSRSFPEGAVLKVRFRLACSGREIRARAEVRYCLPGVGIGVEFLEISPADQLAIESDLRPDST